MKILYIAPKFDYLKPERGFSFEHYNFYDSLVKMENGCHQIIYFPFDEIMIAHGQEKMNQLLIEKVNQEKPDLCFFFLFTDEINKQTIKKITASKKTVTFNWFADDHWRFYNFSRHYAPMFHFVSTTDSRAVVKYQKIGYHNLIKSQWACNHFLYQPQPKADPPLAEKNQITNNPTYQYDVTFIGQPHSDRKKVAENLTNQGIKVDCFGNGWPNGRISQGRMIEIFSQSKINLNLTKSSGNIGVKSLGKILLKKTPNGFKLNPPSAWWENYLAILGKNAREQIKGRNFEIPGCGGFLLSGEADNLNDYYRPDKEIVLFKNPADLTEKIKYYLKHESQRQQISQAGYQRTINEHTYEKRFRKIFTRIFGHE